jgi:DNA polymerase
VSGPEPLDAASKLADLAARTRVWAQARAAEEPGLRVRLAEPLEPAGIPQAVAEILNAASTKGPVGGAKPQPPYADSLEAFQRQISECQRCPLGGKRKRLVFGEGHSAAPLVFVGEGPSAADDGSGRPFSGPAGELLDRMIAAMGFKRADVYLAHVTKCRGQAGKAPTREEAEACLPYLRHQLSLLKPKAIISFGAYATGVLGGTAQPLTEQRGRWGRFQEIPVMPTYHPDEVLRDEGLKKFVWADLKLVMKHLQA